MAWRTRLPTFLSVRKTPLQGRGLYTCETLKKHTVVFEEDPLALGIAGRTLKDVKSVCSVCLKPATSKTPIECNECHAVGYCSTTCLNEAKPLHSIECRGLKSLEKLRGDPSVIVPIHRSRQLTTDRVWPPAEVVLAARILNQEMIDDSPPKLSEFAKGPSSIEETFDFLVPRLSPLLHPSIDSEPAFLQRVFSSLSATSVHLDIQSDFNGLMLGVYEHHMLLNHSCERNCSYGQLGSKMVVYADQEITPGEQLCISYIGEWVLALPGEYRRDNLKSNWGFECHCVMCAGEMEETLYRLRDQQKRSLTAPWTKQRAETVMKEGVQGLEEMNSRCASNRDWPAICGIGEALFKQQKQVLGEMNSVRTLTAYFLMKAYYHQGHFSKALHLAESIRKPVEEYYPPQLFSEYLALRSHCYFDTGHVTQGIKDCIQAVKLYPRNINFSIGPGSLMEATHRVAAIGDVNAGMEIMTLLKDIPVYVGDPGSTSQGCKMQ